MAKPPNLSFSNMQLVRPVTTLGQDFLLGFAVSILVVPEYLCVNNPT